MKKVYVFLAEGFEEMEAVTPIDLLRRAGADAKLVSVTGNRAVTGAHGVTYLADLLFEEIEEDADMLVLPGGLPGTTNLQAHEGLTRLLLQQHEAHKWGCGYLRRADGSGCFRHRKGQTCNHLPRHRG